MNKKLFNINIYIPKPEHLKLIKPVTKLNIFENNSQVFESEGLFSTDIFGSVGSDERLKKFGYIDMKLGILHPLVYQHILSLKSHYGKILDGTMKARYDSKLKEFVPDEDGNTGYDYFIQHIHKLQYHNPNNSDLREDKIKLVKKFANKESLIHQWLVAPAGLRDYVIDDQDNPSENEVNDIYRRVMKVANTLATLNIDEERLYLFDKMRIQLQKLSLEIYLYYKSLLDGKKKHIQGKFSKRGITYGTRNVITASANSMKHMDEVTPGYNDTIIGVYQLSKALGPITFNKLNIMFLSRIFGSSENVMLVNPNTMKSELKTIPLKLLEKWTSMEGLNSIFDKMKQDSIKSEPITVDGYYLMLIYDDGKVVKPIFNTDEIDESMDEKYIRPITYIEIVFISIYGVHKKYPATITRYPVTGLGSKYPTKSYLKSTIKSRTVTVHMLGKEIPMHEYPVLNDRYFNSLSPNFSRLGRQGADFDGDKDAYNILLTDDSVKEIEDKLNSIEYYVTPEGDLTFSLETDNTELIFKHLSREPRSDIETS